MCPVYAIQPYSFIHIFGHPIPAERALNVGNRAINAFCITQIIRFQQILMIEVTEDKVAVRERENDTR
jgi:hypothetical protein